jgi:hypothetical protein
VIIVCTGHDRKLIFNNSGTVTWGLPQRVSNQALIPVRTANGCARSLIELYSAIQPGDYPTRRFRTGTSRATTGGASGVIKDLITGDTQAAFLNVASNVSCC